MHLPEALMNVGMPLSDAVEPTADGLRAARKLIVESLHQWAVDEREANAVLDIANELMSNAVQHPRPPIALRVELDQINGTITVVVSDGATAPARPLPYRAACRSVGWACGSWRSCPPRGGSVPMPRASRSGRRSRRPETACHPGIAEHRGARSVSGSLVDPLVCHVVGVERQQLFQMCARQSFDQLATVARRHRGVLNGRLCIPNAAHDGLQGDAGELLRQCDRQLAVGCLLSHHPIMCRIGAGG
jgi:hypothetical protein